MSYPVLARRDTALDDAETVALLRDRLGDGVVGDVAEYGELTVVVASAAWHAAVTTCRDDDRLAFDLFDCLFGVDAGEAGLDVVAVLYSTSKGRRVMLRTRCEGGRENPVVPSVADVFAGANWHEREAFDMFGIDFSDHPGLLPRILCVENFEGWPLRKEFPLASRVAKPWPGVKDPAEPDEDGNVVVREPAIGEAPGPSGLDEIIAKQAREANPTADNQIEADQGASGGADAANAASEEPTREEVALDQEVYDQLIADGKSERIARSKAKAAFIKKQRAAEREAAEAEEVAGSADGGTADGDDAPPSPDGEVGGATEGETADEAAPAPSVPADEPGGSDDGDGASNTTTDPDQTADTDQTDTDQADTDQADTDQAGDDGEAAPTAAASAEATRAEQVAAREAKAAEASEPSSQDDDLEPIPAAAPPPEEADDETDDEADEATAPGDADGDADETADTASSDDPEGEADDATDIETDDETSTDDTATDDTETDGAEGDGSADEAPAEDEDAPAAAEEDAADDQDSDEQDLDDDGPEVPEPGPFGPGSAHPRADGSGPQGWTVKATSAGNVYHTADSPNWRQAEADVWFEDAATAEAAGFGHWDPYERTDLAAPEADAGDDDEVEVMTGPTSTDVEAPAAPTGAGGSTATHDIDGDDQVERVHDGQHEGVHDGPYGPGSAIPAAGGAGPDGWLVKATSTGNVFHTPDSPAYDDVTADAWFVDDDAARAAGFEHWDPQRRDGLTYDDVGEGVLRTDQTIRGDAPPNHDSATASDDDPDAGPGPVGGTLERDGGTANPDRTDEEPRGFGALDTHEREPVAELPADNDDDGADDEAAGASDDGASDVGEAEKEGDDA